MTDILSLNIYIYKFLKWFIGMQSYNDYIELREFLKHQYTPSIT